MPNLSYDPEVFPFTINIEANTFKWQEPSTLAVTFSRAWKFCFGLRCLVAPAYSLKALNHGVLYVTTGTQ